MTTPYKSKFQESYDMDAFNAFLEKEVPGFGKVGPEDTRKANEYYKRLIEVLQGYIDENERFDGHFLPKTKVHRDGERPEQIRILVDELTDAGLDHDEAYMAAMDFVSGDERREEIMNSLEDHPALNVLKKYENDLEFDGIFPGT